MSYITLFDAAQQVRESLGSIDPDTGELIETYAESRALFEQKAVACVAYAKDEESNLEAAKTMLKQMQEKLKTRELRLDRFKAYMADCMKATGITEVKHESGLFGAKLYIDRDESIVIEDGAKFPASLSGDPKPPEPSKTKIKAAIKAGEAVAGASIVRKDRLVIS
ncbi:siphovirus Gp157 family protein [Comamonas sp. Y6]|uniref:Siphovirus Gp157 family protein n=1 Tax=Comamonas resistens TaxID=3046670 RepID=A0ABY8T0H4_9BURK|nr:siphovirus Gp157 family protein [Comamonas resistens]MDL5036806.1 siphovirus Gp157 family protein [Comamonas resistens]WHS67116.1 siphovirus Gp157 family protein [Comamonas resistens]